MRDIYLYKGDAILGTQKYDVEITADQLVTGEGCHKFYKDSKLIMVIPINAIIITNVILKSVKAEPEEDIVSAKEDNVSTITKNIINHNLEEIK